MKSKKILAAICALMLLTLTACSSGDAAFVLGGKSFSLGSKLSALPVSYYEQQKEQTLAPGSTNEISSGISAVPYYKLWIQNNSEKECTFAQADMTAVLMVGGKPEDLTVAGITFGQSQGDVSKQIDAYKKEKNAAVSTDTDPEMVGPIESAMRSVFFKTDGEQWSESIYILRYNFSNDEVITVAFRDNVVYALALTAPEKDR